MKIAFVGDIGFFGRFSMAENNKVKDYFADVAKHLSQFDYVIGNLELPFLDDGKALGAKSANLKSPSCNVELLKYLNINIVTLANNHIYDFGWEGVTNTVNLLNENNILHFGLKGEDLVLPDEKLAFHGYCCYSTNPYGLGEVINTLSVPAIKEKMAMYKSRGLLNIVSSHAGLEHINFPAYHDVKMARALSEAGPYIYYGHHPHVLQGIEKCNESIIAYSLGNFCFDDVYTDKSDAPLIKQSDNNKTSAILEVAIDNEQCLSHQVTKIYMGEEKMIVGGDIESKIKEYTDFLATEESQYSEHRNQLFANYVADRKQMRDFNWYIKRLNFNSVIMLLRAKYNAKQHQKHILQHLE